MLLLSAIATDKSQAESFSIPGPDDRPETGVHRGIPGFEILEARSAGSIQVRQRKLEAHPARHQTLLSVFVEAEYAGLDQL